MTPSTTDLELTDDDVSIGKPPTYKYDLRLEIGTKNEGGTVPVAAIFYDLVRHLKAAADDDAPVAVLTATDKLFHEVFKGGNTCWSAVFVHNNSHLQALTSKFCKQCIEGHGVWDT